MGQIVNRRRVIGGGVDYTKQYLTFVSMADNNEIKFFTNDDSHTQAIYVSTNRSSWTSKTSASTGTTCATLGNGEKLYVRVSVNRTGYSNGTFYHHFEATGNFALEGNIMSLLYSDNFWQQTALPNYSHTFYSMFSGCSTLVDITNLVLPATTLAINCYDRLFYNCSGLTSIPSGLLPATTLETHCYGYMFYGCTSITSLPSTLLPATALADYCYEYMFRGTGITSLPEGLLPATTLAVGCYQYMFLSSSVASVPSNLLPATTLANSCYRAMFSTCASLAAAPDLPAGKLVAYCYRSMFYQCTSIKYMRCLATSGLSTTECTQAWLTGNPGGGTFYAKSNASWKSGTSGIPSNWTRVNV